MIEGITILASSLPRSASKTKENCSIVFVSKDNKSFAINLLSSTSTDPESIPGSVTVTSVAPKDSKILCRIVSDQNMTRNAFTDIAKCKVIANSVNDRLKAYRILNELESCL